MKRRAGKNKESRHPANPVGDVLNEWINFAAKPDDDAG
jgi:hypothetical protein